MRAELARLGPEGERGCFHQSGFGGPNGGGNRLVEAVGQLAGRQGCTRLWVITTNDNVDALRFYQRRGFCLVRVHRGAVDRSRASLKP